MMKEEIGMVPFEDRLGGPLANGYRWLLEAGRTGKWTYS
jgi:hypothetical protein